MLYILIESYVILCIFELIAMTQYVKIKWMILDILRYIKLYFKFS
jgi:hypothetical protein